MIFDSIIIGGGAAGLMTALTAGKRGKKVLVLDHGLRIGQKILISGGGRCNFTNLTASPANYLSNNSHFCKSALARYTPNDFVDLVKSYQIPFYEKKSGQLFCTNSARDIVNLLLEECKKGNVEIQSGVKATQIEKLDEKFHVTTSRGKFTTHKLVIATGGLSIPKIGASDFGYKIAKQFGLSLIPPQAALDGLVWQEADQKKFSLLSGISLPAKITINKKSILEDLLFTHVGLSGPAVLTASLYWNQGDLVTLDLLPHISIKEYLIAKKQEGSKAEIKTLLSFYFPQRLAELLDKIFWPKNLFLQKASHQTIEDFAKQIHNFSFVPARTVGYQKAEVTKGGVNTNELSSQTMESKKIAGLYFVGEVVDVTGELGGFNFQWAWASGHACGESL